MTSCTSAIAWSNNVGSPASLASSARLTATLTESCRAPCSRESRAASRNRPSSAAHQEEDIDRTIQVVAEFLEDKQSQLTG